MIPPRTNAALVQAVLGNDYSVVINPNPYITAASSIVDYVVAHANSNRGITSDQATQIETWLSAHLYMVMQEQYSSRRAEGASATFQGKTGTFLTSTFYGQMAITLDTSGILEQIGTGPRKMARLYWLGEPIPECDSGLPWWYPYCGILPPGNRV